MTGRIPDEDERSLLDLLEERELIREEIADQQDPLHYQEGWDE